MGRVSYCTKAETNTNCLVRFDSKVNDFFLQSVIYFVSLDVCVCVRVCECVSTKTTSNAGSQPQVLSGIKQEISALSNKHTRDFCVFFLVTSLPPAAASKHLIFCCVFSSLKFS